MSKSKKTSKKATESKEELTEALKRVQAEFENYKKRVEREQTDRVKYSGELILKKFLPILDNLELALSHVKHTDDFTKGIELIYASIIDLIASEDVSEIPALGLPFDPYRHEALLHKESNEHTNTVIEVLQKGYVMHDKVLRPAKVAISKGGKRK